MQNDSWQQSAKSGCDRPLILYVVNCPDFFLSHRLSLAKAVRDTGFNVHVATPTGAGAEQIREEGFVFHEIPMSRKETSPIREVGTILSLCKLYRKVGPDLIHHVTIKPVIYGSIAARITLSSAVINAITGAGHIFTDEKWRTRIIRHLLFPAYKFSFRYPNCHVIFQNQDNAHYFIEAGLVTPEISSVIRGSGVDMSEFTPGSQPGPVPVILLAARMLWSKGVGTFVDAARIINKDCRRARFVLAGDTDKGNPAAISRRQIQDWNDSGIIEWWGKRRDMPNVMSQSDIVCLPTYGEGVPKVLIEAAACAKPIVATDVPGCRDIVKDGENGILVPPRDPPKLAQAITELLADPDRRNTLGKKGREIARSQFAIEIVIDQTLALYRKMLAS